MAFFKSDEEKLKEEQDEIKQQESLILKYGEYNGNVGHIHQGLSSFGLWGTLSNGKIKYRPTKFKIYDTKLLIERNKTIANYSDIKEIFLEDGEAIIILNEGDGIPIKRAGGSIYQRTAFKAFLNILNRLIEENKSNTNNMESDEKNNQGSTEKSEDKFDKLIKLGEMHDKGLLSDEEFASLKQELLSGNNNEEAPVENNVEDSTKYCKNCGTVISSDSVFCTECGTQINNN